VLIKQFKMLIQPETEPLYHTQASSNFISASQRDTPLPSDIHTYTDTSPGQINQYTNIQGIQVIAFELSLGGRSPYTSTDKTNKNKYT
jgi:hypothetical protein